MNLLSKIFRIVDLRTDVRNHMSYLFDEYLKEDMTVYDIGCGPNPFSKKLKAKVKEHVGVDIEDGFYESGAIDLVGSAYDVPVDDKIADAVISSQVIEHLDQPNKAITETSRILKDGGLFLCSFPFLYPIHADPHDFTRYTEFYMEKVLKENGMEITHQKKIGGFWYVIGMYWGIYLQTFDRGILSKIKLVKAFSWLSRWFFMQMQSLERAVLKLLGKNPDNISAQWVVNYVIVAKKAS